MTSLYQNILKTVGRTPVVRINRLAPPKVNMFVKCEFFNPMSSIKDRMVIGIIEDAERTGKLKPGQTIVEVTSGNTGIATAMVCAVKGYRCVLCVPEYYSIERRKIMKFLGAEVLVTPESRKASGAGAYAEALADKNGWFRIGQFENPANPEVHRNTTAAEILSDFGGQRLDYFVSGYGSGGTLTGVGPMLKHARPDIEIVCGEPETAKLLQGEDWDYHIVEGWSTDFIPDVLDRTVPDSFVSVTNEGAVASSRALGAKEGIFTGLSGGASFNAALQVAERAPEGSSILTMLPDTGERYLSQALFEGITEKTDYLPSDEDVDFEKLFEEEDRQKAQHQA